VEPAVQDQRGEVIGIPASIRASVEAFRRVDRREPSMERMVRVKVIRE